MTRRTRTAFTITELIAAVAVIGALLVLVTQLLTTVTTQVRKNQRRLAVTESSSNLMELVTSLPFHEISSEIGDRPDVRKAIAPLLDLWLVEIRVDELEDEPYGKRIEISASPRIASDPTAKPIRLIGWKYLEADTLAAPDSQT